MSTVSASPNIFPETRATFLMQAQEGNERARDKLAKAYWQPLYFFALRSFHLDHHQAQDLVQEFFVNKFWTCVAAKQGASMGRLRTFLIKAFKHAYFDIWRKERTLKRNLGVEILPLDDELSPAAVSTEDQKADMDYDRDWALNLWERTTEELFQTWQQKRSQAASESGGVLLSGESPVLDRFNALVAHGVIARDPAKVKEPDYTALATTLNESEANTRQIVSRARKEFRRLFREEVRHTLAATEQLDEEVTYVINILLAESRTALLP